MIKLRAFTLIEVLIAVIILSIALIAVMRNTALVASQTSYLQERTLAHWVAMDIMAQVRTGFIAAPPTGSNRGGSERMLNQDWDWELITSATAQATVIKTQVIVYPAGRRQSMDSISSYLLLAKS